MQTHTENIYGADDYIEKHHISDLLADKLYRLISSQDPADCAFKASEPFHRKLPDMSRTATRKFELSLLNHEVAHHVDRDVLYPTPQHVSECSVARENSSEMTVVMPESLSLDVSIFQKEECDIPHVDEEDPDAIKKARRLARIIISDSALYNQEAVIGGIRNGTLLELLKNDVNEGREFYETRIPAALRAKKGYYQEAFDNFIGVAKRKNVR